MWPKTLSHSEPFRVAPVVTSQPVLAVHQTAIAVSDGAPLLTDRDQRIKVQFPCPDLERRWRIACVLSTLLYGGILAGMTVIGWTM